MPDNEETITEPAFDLEGLGYDGPPESEESAPPIETPAPVAAAPSIDYNAMGDAIANRLTAALKPADAADPCPTWDEFTGTLDEFVDIKADWRERQRARTAPSPTFAIDQAVTVVREGQALDSLLSDQSAEVRSLANEWFNQVPRDQITAGTARAIAAQVVGQSMLNQRGKASAPSAVRDTGVPVQGRSLSSQEDQMHLQSMKRAFPTLSDKEIMEIVRNNG